MPTPDLAAAVDRLKAFAAESGDRELIDAIRAIGDAISVGNISNSQGIAVGKNIRQVFNRFELTPELAAGLTQLRPLAGAPLLLDPDLDQHSAIIADKSRDFVGRDYVFRAIDEFIAANGSGYFVIQGDPGLGKSALIAEYVRRTGCLAHFNTRSLGITRASQFIPNICAQLIAEAQLPYATLPSKATEEGSFFLKLLREAAETLTPGNRLVIAIDALDEVDEKEQPAGSNILFLPATLPDGVYIIMTRRNVDRPFVVTSPLDALDMMAHSTENRGDVETFLTRASERDTIVSWIRDRQLAAGDFVRKLADLSQDNFMYLRYVLPEIERGKYKDLGIERLPVGLEGYYQDHWDRMGMTAKPLPRVKIRIVYILSEVHMPITRKQIAAFATDDALKVDELSVQEVLDEWQQFLIARPGDPVMYSLYHASFRDFLHRKDVVQAAGVTLQAINGLISGNLIKQLYG